MITGAAEPSRNSPGQVRDAIVSVFRTRDGVWTVRELHEAVSQTLGREIPSSSVRSYLRLNSDVFQRTERGQYQLVCEKESQLALLSTELDEETNGGSPILSVGRPHWETYEFGLARLVLADCLDWLDAAAANSIHAVVTDPPYGLVEYTPLEQRKLRAGKGGVWRIPPSFDGHARSPLPRFTTLKPPQVEELRRFFADWGRRIYRVLTPGAHVVVASNPLLSHVVADALATLGFERRGEIIRLVMTMRGGDRPKNAHEEFSGVSVMPRSMWEPWLLFRKPLEGRVQDNLRKWGTGGLRRISEERPFGDVIESHPTQPKERRIAPHPSLKPQAFLRQIVRAVLPLGRGIVLDPFAGSGSTLAAADALGYESIGIETDPDYFAVAKNAIPELAHLPVKTN